MSVLWVICGAGRGVGKTYLAQRLVELLPKALYAKLGHGNRDPDKHPNFFHDKDALGRFLDDHADTCEHLVIESNVHARTGEGDIIIYIGHIAGQTDVRDDADTLRAQSDIHIQPGASQGDWQSVLEGTLDNTKLCEEVGEILLKQAQFLNIDRPAVRSKVWFEIAGRRAFGPGLAHLLDGTRKLGSLRAAADAASMSYRHAWGMIDEAERRLGSRLMSRHSGGADGGGSELTDRGLHLLEVFHRLSTDVARYADERFAQMYDSDGRETDDTTR
ncbi:MAG: LysR family transcriptional regulator [Armatimonadota bacterium]